MKISTLVLNASLLPVYNVLKVQLEFIDNSSWAQNRHFFTFIHCNMFQCIKQEQLYNNLIVGYLEVPASYRKTSKGNDKKSKQHVSISCMKQIPVWVQPVWMTTGETDINTWRILVKRQPAHLQSTEFAHAYWLEENLLLCTWCWEKPQVLQLGTICSLLFFWIAMRCM